MRDIPVNPLLFSDRKILDESYREPFPVAFVKDAVFQLTECHYHGHEPDIDARYKPAA